MMDRLPPPLAEEMVFAVTYQGVEVIGFFVFVVVNLKK